MLKAARTQFQLLLKVIRHIWSNMDIKFKVNIVPRKNNKVYHYFTDERPINLTNLCWTLRHHPLPDCEIRHLGVLLKFTALTKLANEHLCSPTGFAVRLAPRLLDTGLQRDARPRLAGLAAPPTQRQNWLLLKYVLYQTISWAMWSIKSTTMNGNLG